MTISQRSWWTFKLLTRISLYVPLSLLVLLALLLGTEIGARLSVSLANRLVPDLQLVYRSGVINQDLTLAQANWSMPGIKVELNELHLAWQPACLLQSKLCVNALDAAKVKVLIDTEQLSSDTDSSDTDSTDEDSIDGGASSDPLAPDEAPTELVLPFGIVLDRAQLQDIQVTVDDMQFAATRIDTSASWFTQGLTVHQLSSQGLSVLLPLDSNQPKAQTAIDTQAIAANTATAINAANGINDGQALNNPQAAAHTQAHISNPNGNTNNNSPSNTTASVQTSVEDWPLADLPSVFMPFPIIVQQLELQDSRLQLGERQDSFSHAQLQGSFRQSQLTVTKLALSHPDGTLDVTGQLKFEQDYPLALNIALQLKQLAELPELTNLAVNLQLSDSLGQLRLKANVKGD
ncbi:MAG: translocation/assembly module TamB domain-containing protein, partial [Shewanella sp.]